MRSVIRCCNPKRAACAPVKVLLSSCQSTNSACVPELAGACEATRSATAWKLSPRSSAQSASIHKKSRYCRSLFPSATLAKMMSALVMLNLRPIKPVSFTSLAHTLMFMSTPLPAAKDV